MKQRRTFVRFSTLLMLASLTALIFTSLELQGQPTNNTKKTQTPDGVILIDQQRALEGNITPGDTPGFPVLITTPGSYRLASNLVVADANLDAIFVNPEVQDVTLDLNGFTIEGPCARSGVLSCDQVGQGRGILTISPAKVFNGTIIGFGSIGLFCNSVCDIERVNVRGNGGLGIVLMVGSIRNSNVGGNLNLGIRVVDLGLVSGNVVDKLSMGGAVGYVNNEILISVTGGVQLGSNLCLLHLCP
jgi:hypothetical protein